MSLLVTGIGAGVSLGASIYGKHREAKERRRLNRFINQQSENLENWYRKESNTNYLDTAEGQSQYQGLRRMLRENTNRVDNSLVKAGGTAEAGVAARESAGKTVADATRQMAGMGTNRQMTLRNIYQGQKNSYDAMKMGAMQGKADAWSTFANNAGGVASSWMGVGAESGEAGWGDLFSSLKKRKENAGGATT